ncbi:MAG: LLM class F420-dependent oxidoreductase [Solirubrobacterales bacterium]
MADAAMRAAMSPNFVGPGAVEKAIEMSCWAESIGYQDVWLGDAGAIDALTLAAILLDRTKSVRIGVAVTPVYTRTPAVLAATVATLGDIAPGRFVLGLGSGSHAMVEGWHGIGFRKPLARVRETVTVLRQMLAGEKVDFVGDTIRTAGYRQPALEVEVPIVLAALRPGMLELAATVADGVVLNLFPIGALPQILDVIATALGRADRDPDQFEVAARMQVLVTDDVEGGRKLFRRTFAPYYATPVYNRFLSWVGHGVEAKAIREAAVKHDWDGARAAISDELIDAVAVIGSAEHCRARLCSLAAAGVETPMLYCLSDDRDIERETLSTLASQRLRDESKADAWST